MRTIFFAASLAVLIVGCAKDKALVPTGGSRSDGTVDLSYDYTIVERPKLDLQQGLVAARERCKAWGYSDAQPFGGQTQTCNMPSGSGCEGWHVTMTYQCIGRG